MIEHVEDFPFFISEIERISSQGYIELPTRLGDNLIFENVTDHIWWFVFDDTKKTFHELNVKTNAKYVVCNKYHLIYFDSLNSSLISLNLTLYSNIL